MAITFPLVDGWTGHFEAATSARSKNVGTGSNRKCVVVYGYTGDGGGAHPTPSGFTVGSDTLTLQGSVYTGGTGDKFACYIGDLTVTGSQTCTASFTAGTGISGFSYIAILVVQGDASLSLANLLTLLEQTTGGAGGTTSRTVTSTSGQTVVYMGVETGNQTATAGGSGSLITGSAAFQWFEKYTASSSSTSVSLSWTPFAAFESIGFTVVEVDTTAPTITGPGGATGSTATLSMAENSTTVATLTASESVTWSITGGADAAKFAINSSTGVLTFVTTPNYESPTDADANNTYVVQYTATDPSSNATAQTLTVTITNANEAPTFSGTIPNFSGPPGGAIPSTSLTSYFADQDSGDTATYSKGGSWPSGPTLSSGGTLAGVYPAVGVYGGLTVIRTDAASLTATSNSFSIAGAAGPTINTQPAGQSVTSPVAGTFTVSASGTGTLTYQWQRQPVTGGGYVDVAGATSASYTTGATSVTVGSHNNGDTYRVNVSDSNGTTTSSPATLTVAAVPGVFVSEVLKRNNGSVAASVPLTYVRWYDPTTGALVLSKSGLSTNGSGIFSTTDAALASGVSYAIDWLESTGQRRMPIKAAT